MTAKIIDGERTAGAGRRSLPSIGSSPTAKQA
jgi:hypothetical protein